MAREDITINWLKRAKSNLIRAKIEKLPDVYWEDLCYDAQQACEKSLKALLIFNEIKFRFVHDIGELINTLEKKIKCLFLQKLKNLLYCQNMQLKPVIHFRLNQSPKTIM